MSRIGKQPIHIPEGVSAALDGNNLEVKGPKGALCFEVPRGIRVKVEKNELKLAADLKIRNISRTWGLTRALIANMVHGVKEGYKKELVMEGVGYKAQLEGKELVLYVGRSHPVRIPRSEEVQFSVEKNVIVVSGVNKQAVGEMAARIRSTRKAEPYKGSGIRYKDEIIRRKAGKKAVSAGA